MVTAVIAPAGELGRPRGVFPYKFTLFASRGVSQRREPIKTVLLSTVAAAVLALAGVASAQSNLPSEKSPAPDRAPAAQQHAPAEKVAPAMKAGEKKAPSSAQIKQKHETTGASTKSEEKTELKGEKSEKTEKSQLKGEKAPSNGAKVDSKSKATVDSKTNSKVDSKTGATVDSKTNSKVDSKSSVSSDKPGVKNETTAQGSIAAGAKLSTEQRTKIVTVFHKHRVAPAKLDISIHVGARVPSHVHFYPVPREVVVIYPEWRGYDYILVGDEILIINPRTHEIVAILEA
jgi:hypothetical protein